MEIIKSIRVFLQAGRTALLGFPVTDAATFSDTPVMTAPSSMIRRHAAVRASLLDWIVVRGIKRPPYCATLTWMGNCIAVCCERKVGNWSV